MSRTWPWMSRESWLESREELSDTIKRWCLYFGTMVIWKGQGINTGVMGVGEEEPLSVGQPYGMEVRPSKALDTDGSAHLTIDYLLRIDCGDLEFEVGWLR